MPQERALITGRLRSNYFKVKDRAAFEALCKRSGAIVVESNESREAVGFYADQAALPPDGNKDFVDALAGHVADGWAAVLVSVGWVDMQLLFGTAIAVNNKGERREINLRTITTLAHELAPNVTEPIL